jgi:hypothetical protein
VYIANNPLTVGYINSTLIQLDGFGEINGFYSAQGGIGSAPSGAGIIAKNNLILKGWNVYTN